MTPTLADRLPDEVWLRVARAMPLRAQATLACVCRRLARIVRDPHLARWTTDTLVHTGALWLTDADRARDAADCGDADGARARARLRMRVMRQRAWMSLAPAAQSDACTVRDTPTGAPVRVAALAGNIDGTDDDDDDDVDVDDEASHDDDADRAHARGDEVWAAAWSGSLLRMRVARDAPPLVQCVRTPLTSVGRMHAVATSRGWLAYAGDDGLIGAVRRRRARALARPLGAQLLHTQLAPMQASYMTRPTIYSVDIDASLPAAIVASAAHSGGVRFWSVRDDAGDGGGDALELRALLSEHAGVVYVVRLARGTGTAYTGGADTTIKATDVARGVCVGSAFGHTLAVHCVAVDAPASLLVSGSWDGTVRMFDTRTLRAVSRPVDGAHRGAVYAVALGEWQLVTGGTDGRALLFDRRIVRAGALPVADVADGAVDAPAAALPQPERVGVLTTPSPSVAVDCLLWRPGELWLGGRFGCRALAFDA